MKVTADNPAGRLYDILSKTKAQPQHNALGEVLSAALNASNSVDFHKRLVCLKELVAEVRQIVENSEGINKELYLSHYSQIENLVNARNYDMPWNNVSNLLNEPALINIAHIAEILPSTYRENLIEEDALNDLISTIEELIKRVKDSSLLIELQRIIIDQLYLTLNSIYAYKIRGARGLKEALSNSYGEFFLNYELFKSAKDFEEVKEYKTILKKIHTVVTGAFTYYQITQEGIKLLLGS